MPFTLGTVASMPCSVYRSNPIHTPTAIATTTKNMARKFTQRILLVSLPKNSFIVMMRSAEYSGSKLAIKNRKEVRMPLLLFCFLSEKTASGLFFVVLAGNGQFLAAFGTTRGQYLTSIRGGHSFAESMFSFSPLGVGLIRSFHCYIMFLLFVPDSGCKIRHFFQIKQALSHFPPQLLCFFSFFH